MPGPLARPLPPELPAWADPKQASVFDTLPQTVLRKVVGLMGLDDPQQVMALGVPLETGAMTGGALEALAGKFPRFAKAIQSVYKSPTAGGVPAAPFYSRLDEAAAALPKQTFGPKVLGVVQKGQASAEELAARGVPQFVAGYGNKPIPKAALDAHLAANPVPQLEVKTLGGPRHTPPVVTLEDLRVEPTEHSWLIHTPGRTRPLEVGKGTVATADEARDYALRYFRDNVTIAPERATKFSNYQLPGGEHYKETLITLPQGKPDAYTKAVQALEAKHGPNYRAEMTNGEIDALDVLGNDRSQHTAYRSSHFDEPNIVAHTRSNERTLPGLGKGTFLEEVQSDWHQQGKAKGYGPQTEVIAYYETPTGHVPLGYGKTEAEALANSDPGWKDLVSVQYKTHEIGHGVPDAPFKESWPELALKHHLAEAAQDPAINWIGFTSGETQAARYDLSKQISKLEYVEGSNKLRAWDVNGHAVLDQQVAAEDLADHVGKEAAQKLLGSEDTYASGSGLRVRRLEGVDLKVGGEGMHHFYDNLLPKRLEKIVKPYGGTVERSTLGPGRSAAVIDAEIHATEAARPRYWVNGSPVTAEDLSTPAGREAADRVANYGDDAADWAAAERLDALRAERKQTVAAPIWILKLTPQLKERILKYGLPLMSVAGVAVGPEEEDR